MTDAVCPPAGAELHGRSEPGQDLAVEQANEQSTSRRPILVAVVWSSGRPGSV